MPQHAADALADLSRPPKSGAGECFRRAARVATMSPSRRGGRAATTVPPPHRPPARAIVRRRPGRGTPTMNYSIDVTSTPPTAPVEPPPPLPAGPETVELLRQILEVQ